MTSSSFHNIGIVSLAISILGVGATGAMARDAVKAGKEVSTGASFAYDHTPSFTIPADAIYTKEVLGAPMKEFGKVTLPMPDNKMLSHKLAYFELKRGSKAGEEVIGRINLINNSKQKATFSIVGGIDGSLFSVKTITNSIGKSFGVISFKGKVAEKPKYVVKVKADFKDGSSSTETYTITLVDEYFAETYFQSVKKWKPRKAKPQRGTDKEIAEDMQQIQPDGSFPNYSWACDHDGWFGLIQELEKAYARTLAYQNPKSTFFQSTSFRDKLYLNICNLAAENRKFKLDNYDNHVHNTSDLFSAIGLALFKDLWQQMKSGDKQQRILATKTYDALRDGMDAMWGEDLNIRPVLANANRNHRFSSLTLLPAITYDYNRPITDEDVWFDRDDQRIEGYHPTGAYRDLIQLVETSHVPQDVFYNVEGFYPDGTICHHPKAGIQWQCH